MVVHHAKQNVSGHMHCLKHCFCVKHGLFIFASFSLAHWGEKQSVMERSMAFHLFELFLEIFQ